MRARGFTLIELMVVVVIVGILAAMAMPSYRQSVIKTRRTDARVALTALAQRLERCRTQYGLYNDAACPVSSPQDSPDGYYTVTVERTATTFSLTAAPRDSQADDRRCGSFGIDHRGARWSTGTDRARCW